VEQSNYTFIIEKGKLNFMKDKITDTFLVMICYGLYRSRQFDENISLYHIETEARENVRSNNIWEDQLYHRMFSDVMCNRL
jgi:hypothetical protein